MVAVEAVDKKGTLPTEYTVNMRAPPKCRHFLDVLWGQDVGTYHSLAGQTTY